MNTIAFYDDNADDFLARTANVDMSNHRQRFLAHIPDGGSVLDAGSGSGRDSKAFKDLGYQVSAFDASIEMVKATRSLAGVEARQMTFQEYAWGTKFNGIWACASLLHVPRAELPTVLDRLASTLILGGWLYASFKLGTAERRDGERYFNDMNLPLMEAVVGKTTTLELHETWESMDRKLNTKGGRWLNCLMFRRS